jgi:hypothetical protein
MRNTLNVKAKGSFLKNKYFRMDNQKYKAMSDILQGNIDVARDHFFKRTDGDIILAHRRDAKENLADKKTTKSGKFGRGSGRGGHEGLVLNLGSWIDGGKKRNESDASTRVQSILDDELENFWGLDRSEPVTKFRKCLTLGIERGSRRVVSGRPNTGY